ncbi:Z1 domain-containing protein [Agromyces binzhouensis]|uniref:Z1 domain-containing protein n=1 Tax=Agromyces binzhouensis TaxID=1817495 RepID=UPI00362B1558
MTNVNTSAQKEQLQKVVLTWAGTNSTVPDEDAVRAILVGMKVLVAPDLNSDDIDSVFDNVSRILSIRMDMGAVIEGAQHLPWVENRRSAIDWRLWDAYSAYLAEHGRSPLVLDKLNRSLDIILDHMGDPGDSEPWERRGLVIGDVQSGKTSTYIGLMDKAADAGYRIFIVLTGNTESLRRQTQARIDEGMIGRDSAAALLGARRGVAGDKDNRLGVGLKLESNSSIASTTTMLTDFKKSAAEAMNIVPGEGLSIVFVTKKNKIVLDRIADWLESQQHGGKLKHPLLFLDDEADFASINTNKPELDPTAINNAIRRILATSSRNSYIGFTATPFANIFINDEDDKDLFPRDFIYALDAPTNYRGATRMFGSVDAEDNEVAGDDDAIRILEDAEEYFPASHKSTLAVSGLPESLLEALRTFLLANAIRDLRGEAGTPRSMLVNVSRFNAVQKRLGDLLLGELAAYRNAINSHAVTFANGRPNAELEALRDTFHAEFGATGFDWSKVLGALPAAVADIELKVVNSQRDKAKEEKELRDEDAPRQISIGGDLLSRGLTLEGLIVSYFYRRTAASDTLMQMGRWFGYRDGYEDLCRLWLSAEVVSAYAQTAESLLDLRLELERMRDQKLTPQQYGLAVRNHPGALLITARNKMRSAEIGQKSISLRGRPIESTTLSSGKKRIADNIRAADELFQAIRSAGIEAQAVGRGNRRLWRRVPKKMIASFLEGFTASDSAALFYGNALAKFALNAQADDLQDWDVVLVGGTGEEISLGGVTIKRPVRRASLSSGTWVISGANRRVAGPGDIATPLSAERRAEIEAAFLETHSDANRAPDTEFVQRLDRPTLLVYPVERRDSNDKNHAAPSEAETLVAIVIGVPGSGSSTSSPDQVTYWLNAVAKRLWFPDFDTYGEEDDEY